MNGSQLSPAPLPRPRGLARMMATLLGVAAAVLVGHSPAVGADEAIAAAALVPVEAPALPPPLPLEANQPEAIDFQRDVRPILAAHCFACHGPDDEHRQAGLRLDRRESISVELASGRVAVVPGQPAASELVRRIRAADPDERMPPAEAQSPLGDAEIARLERWIAEGAVFAEHWSLVPPRKHPLPEVANSRWPLQPLDRFILARVEAAGLKPAPEADRYQLVRRLSLDLRGLPPSPEEVEVFLQDTGSGAYERLVERFLADPAYGERWARLWLDLARYADSAGYGSDPLREIWLYRDWVIDAFNRNLSFDRFTIEQLAGDLLPEPDHQQLIATAFHRNTMTNTEGGTDDEEFRIAAVIDRVDTTGQVWLGLTVGCAKCHNHKYDPISQREYYRLLAFFNQSADADLPDESPTLEVPTPAISAQRARIDGEIAALRAKMEEPSDELDAAQQIWEAQLRAPDFPGRDAVTPEVLALIDTSAESRSDDQRRQLAAYYRGLAPALEPLRKAIADLDAARPAIPRVPVMSELPADRRRTTHLLLKGNFLNPGEAVTAATPAALHAWPADAEPNRLGLARWLVHADNPLTARVTVNRFWAALFGAGLVETEEDFGLQGEPPSHPELLDHLAWELVASGWDLKQLLRTIVGSATYRQSSVVTPEGQVRDPRNRLLSRAPRLRLEAEMIRDQALCLAGLLSRKMFGPSVYPPQPEGLWQAAFNGQRTWPTSQGEDRYRRGLYTFWRRTVPYPSLATFDAPSRELCTVRRSRTSTPLQSLVVLNDPVYVEAAQALARRIVRQGGSSAQERVGYGLRLCLVRPPQPEQIETLAALWQAQCDEFRGRGEDAHRLATDPLGPLPPDLDPVEMAAWTVVAQVLLNLDGVLSKG